MSGKYVYNFIPFLWWHQIIYLFVFLFEKKNCAVLTPVLFCHAELFHMAGSSTTYCANEKAFAILINDRSLDFPELVKAQFSFVSPPLGFTDFKGILCSVLANISEASKVTKKARFVSKPFKKDMGWNKRERSGLLVSEATVAGTLE